VGRKVFEGWSAIEVAVLSKAVCISLLFLLHRHCFLSSLLEIDVAVLTAMKRCLVVRDARRARGKSVPGIDV